MCDWPWSLASADGPAQRTRRMGEPTKGVYTPAVPPSPGQPWTCPTAYPLWAWFLGLPRDQGSRRKEKHSLCPSRREACPVSVSLGGCLHSSQCARGMTLVCVTGVMCACVHAGSPALSASRVTLHPQCSPLLASSANSLSPMAISRDSQDLVRLATTLGPQFPICRLYQRAIRVP